MTDYQGIDPPARLYAERDIEDQGEHYVRHVNAMTAEGLHSKSDIAAELAHRDIEIERLRSLIERAHTIISIREVSFRTHKGAAWLQQASRELKDRTSAPESSAFGDIPPRPSRPTKMLDIQTATTQQALEHYMLVVDYWIAEAQWQEKRGDQLNAELTAFLRNQARIVMGGEAALSELPPEFDEAGKNAMRAKARRGLPEAFAEMSDEWIADRVRMLMRQDLWHEAICTAARDRIMRLSLLAEQLTRERDGWKRLNDAHIAESNAIATRLGAERDRLRAALEQISDYGTCGCHESRHECPHSEDVCRISRSALARRDTETRTLRPPDGYAYRRHLPGGDGTYIAFDGGGTVNGGAPIEAVPYWLGPAAPTEFPRKPGECKHATAHLTCTECGIDFHRVTVERNSSGATESPAERAVTEIAATIRTLTGARREAAVRILHSWNEMMRGMPASPPKADERQNWRATDAEDCCPATTRPNGAGYCCTLAPGHPGDHQAWGSGDNLIETWPSQNGEASRS